MAERDEESFFVDFIEGVIGLVLGYSRHGSLIVTGLQDGGQAKACGRVKLRDRVVAINGENVSSIKGVSRYFGVHPVRFSFVRIPNEPIENGVEVPEYINIEDYETDSEEEIAPTLQLTDSEGRSSEEIDPMLELSDFSDSEQVGRDK